MAFARRDYFYRDAAKQKYQNLSQLFFCSLIACLDDILYLSSNPKPVQYYRFVAAHKTILSIDTDFEFGSGGFAYVFKLGH
jgi:hypothetical protein